MFPIKPGKHNYLSGTMGELRGNHFHAGLDIKTDQVVGLNVYASADGFVSRIKVSPYGYGNAIYIQHPNGQTTVYGHLLSFKDDIAKRVIKEHYLKESFAVEIFPEKNEFVVKKGEIIGKSGTSGGSGGPHLHWEIRDRYQRPMNPLLGKFSEVKDNIDPIFYKVGFTTLSKNAHINNEFGFFSLTPIKTSSSTYRLNDIVADGEIGLSINANDKLNGAANRNGVAGIEVYVDNELSFQYENEKFSFATSKMINEHIEYQRYKDGFGKFHKCYVSDGNSLGFYKKNSSQGRLMINDSSKHAVRIKIWDAYNNEASLTFNIIGSKIKQSFSDIKSDKRKVRTRLQENILRVVTSNNQKPLKYYRFGEAYQKEPLYIKKDNAVYTFDLREGIPDSIVKGPIHHNFGFERTIIPSKSFTSYHKKAIVRFSPGVIKDTMYLKFSEKDDVFTIGDYYTPIYKNIKVILKPLKEIKNKSKQAVYVNRGSYYGYVGGTWLGNNIEFNTRSLGTFKILEDKKEPAVRLISKSSSRIKVKISDNLSGIRSYRATLDGKFLCMAYRYQTGVLTSIRQNDNEQLKGLFKIEVIDNMYNKKIYTLQL